MTPKSNPSVKYSHYDGSALDGDAFNISKDSADYYMLKSKVGITAEAGESGYYAFYADLNGPGTAPNKRGIDYFLFLVDNSNGKVYGYGTNRLEMFKTGGDKAEYSWKETCKKGSVTVSKDVSCSGSIMDNGFKIIYPW